VEAGLIEPDAEADEAAVTEASDEEPAEPTEDDEPDES
jgi:hypothetical protein